MCSITSVANGNIPMMPWITASGIVIINIDIPSNRVKSMSRRVSCSIHLFKKSLPHSIRCILHHSFAYNNQVPFHFIQNRNLGQISPLVKSELLK
ncbi:hypothetical protein D3C76_1502110 [compost metagenome]